MKSLAITTLTRHNAVAFKSPASTGSATLASKVSLGFCKVRSKGATRERETNMETNDQGDDAPSAQSVRDPFWWRKWEDPRASRRFVYFIEAKETGLIKIGLANCARARLKQLQTLSPVPLVLLGVVETDKFGALEKDLHRRFAEHRAHGEWFHACEPIRAYIAADADWPPPTRKSPPRRSAGGQ